jgi:uncharacterized repeat protein (TIGR03803 family)
MTPIAFSPGRTLHALAIASVILVLLNSAWAAPKFKVLHAFAGGSDGAYPLAPPVFDRLGNLYGTTEQGGSGTGCNIGCGIVYELMPHSTQWSERVLYNFSGTTDGADPFGALTLAPNGYFYGVDSVGGDPSCNCGEVYQLARTAGVWTKTAIHVFLGNRNGNNDGGYPGAGLLIDSAGNLYGVAAQGGIYGWGVVFELSPNGDGTWTENIIYNFTNSRDGYVPYAPLVMDAAGNLYGTAQAGGIYGGGTVFRLTPSNGIWTESTLFAFTGGDGGGNPNFGVVLDSTGNLYGAADTGGGNFAGVIFKLTPTVGYWNYVLVHTFSGGSDGGNPSSTVTIDAAGNLYGTTLYGGLYQYGTVYKISDVNGKWQETVLHSFTGANDGWQPYGGVVVDSGGNVYGAATQGGRYGFGLAFEITP